MITNKLKIHENIIYCVYISPQLKCDFSGFQSMLVKVHLHNHQRCEIWESHSTNFSTLMIILLLYVEAHIFMLET